MINIIDEKCVGCGVCVSACPFDAIDIKDDKAVILDNCTICGSCVSSCNFDAIDFQKEESDDTIDKSEYHGIWVFGEQRNNEVLPVVFELLGEGRKLAEELAVPLSVVLMGSNLADKAHTLISYGADNVYMVEDESLETYNDQSYTDIFTQLVNTYKPEIILIGATTYGRSLAPRIASRLNTGLTADCTYLSIDKETGNLMQTRPAFGGNLMATIVCPDRRPQMSTVRPKVMKPIEPDSTRTGEVIRLMLTSLKI